MGMITVNATADQQAAIDFFGLNIQKEFSRFLDVYVDQMQDQKLTDLRAFTHGIIPSEANKVLDAAIAAAQKGPKK